MGTGDGLLLRLRLPGGTVSVAGLLAVADVAEQYGNGVVEFSARANLQIRGLNPIGVKPASDLLTCAGLVGADSGRNVVVAPLTGHDPTALVDLSALTQLATELLSSTASLRGLPPKFAVVLDDGGLASTRRLSADMCFGAVMTDDGEVVMQLTLGHALAHAEAPIPCLSLTDVPRVLSVGAQLCAANEKRMGELVDRDGFARLMASLASGVNVRWRDTLVQRRFSAPLGVLNHRTNGYANVGGAPLLGRCSPTMLRSLAMTAQSTSSLVRLTPWRGVVLLEVAQERVAETLSGLERAEFSSDPANPIHLISACAGLPGCRSSRVDTISAARDLLDGSSPITTTIHLSGCEKRCGADAERVMVANDRGLFRGEQ